MLRITINVTFKLEEEITVPLQAYISRTEALKVPELKLQEKEHLSHDMEVEDLDPEDQDNQSKPEPSESQNINKKYIPNGNTIKNHQTNSNVNSNSNEDDELDNQLEKEVENEQQNDNQMQNEEEAERLAQGSINEIDDEEQEKKLIQLLQGDQFSDEIELSSISKSFSTIRKNQVTKTKRQKGNCKGLIQLPDKKPRVKKLDEATELIKREEKEKKRKQYLRKQIQAQEKATLDKILNQTGKKLRMREEKQIKANQDRQQHRFRTLGDEPKIIESWYVQDQKEEHRIMLHGRTLFEKWMTETRMLREKQACVRCGGEGKYKIRGKGKVCSLGCYKEVV